jgi:hypothetical protein
VASFLSAWSAYSVLLQPDGVTTADVATPQYRGVYADIDLVVLGCRAQDARILGQIPLSKRNHHAARTGTGDSQLHLVSDAHRPADPGILDEVLHAAGRFHDHIRPETTDLESALGIQLAKPVKGCSG